MPVSPAVAPPPGSPRFPGVDGLRAVAILMVVLCHALLAAGVPRGGWSWVSLYLSAGVILFFAIVSYGVFLWHYPIVLWLSDIDPRLAGGSPRLADDVVLLTLATLAASIAIATVSYRVVELPFLRRKEPRAAPDGAFGTVEA